MGSGKEFVDAKIASKKVVVISKSYCPFALKAKKVLGKYDIPEEDLEYIEIDDRPDMDEIQDHMRYFINGNQPRPLDHEAVQFKKPDGGQERAARLHRRQVRRWRG